MRRDWDGLLAIGAVALLRPWWAVGRYVSAQEDTVACAPLAGEPTAIATAKLFMEYNATDDDLGVHGAFDDQRGPLVPSTRTGRWSWRSTPKGNCSTSPWAGIFFESRKPPGDELSLDDLKSRFPEGQYEVVAASFDGTSLLAPPLHQRRACAPLSSPLAARRGCDAVVSTGTSRSNGPM